MNQTIATKLIKIYDYVCQKYENELQYHVERFSNNTNQPEFTDQEIGPNFVKKKAKKGGCGQL